MIIGIEAERANHPEKTGVEHYAQQLILHLAKIDQRNHYRLYLRTKPESWFFSLPKNFEVRIIPFPKFWTQIRLSLEMLFHPVDVLFVPASALPLIHPKKSVCTIHDCSFLYYPEADTAFMRNFLNFSYKIISRTAWKIIAISESAKKDLIKFYGTDPEKIQVVYHGYEANQAISNQYPVTSIISKLPEKYLLFVSTLQPRKNLVLLIEAFRNFKNKHPNVPHKLVVVGKPGWKFEPILQAIEQNSDIVTYLGHVTNAEKWEIYRKADAFIAPSLYEGFGMWILEAFDARIPVAVSNISALPEIAGEAAVYFDPSNTREITDAIEKILLDSDLRQSLVAKGTERLNNFSWEQTARETLKVLEGNKDEK